MESLKGLGVVVWGSIIRYNKIYIYIYAFVTCKVNFRLNYLKKLV